MNRHRRRLLLVLPLLPAGCVKRLATAPQIPVEPQIVNTVIRFRKEYLLVPGDQVEISVRRVPEVSRTVTIRSDGKITIPIAEEVQAAGLSPQELDAKLTEILTERLLDPEVTVIPTQTRQPVVYVTGEVNTAAVVPIRDAPTAIQAIAFAGGLRRSGATREISIIRLGDDGFLRAIHIPATDKSQVGPYMSMRTALLQPDDIIFVPESGRSQVARLLEDFLNRPLVGINSILGVYLQFRFVQSFTN